MQEGTPRVSSSLPARPTASDSMSSGGLAGQFATGNRITLLHNGSEYFPALEQAIDAARHQVHLQTYLFADDDTGRRIAAALARAAARGVGVHVVVDGYGSRRYLGGLRETMARANIQVLEFRPEVSSFSFRRHRLRRMHRKLAMIDGAVAFVGGINIIDDMHTPGHRPPRYDYAVRVEGPMLASIAEQTMRLWMLLAWANLQPEWASLPRLPLDVRAKGWQRARFVVRDNFRARSDIEDAYLDAIEHANEEIIIASSYFFPGRQFRRAIVRAAQRGVRVVLLLQGRVEFVLLHYASRALYGSLLDAGVEINEYHKSFLHTKVAVIDRKWATVGSSNIDPFSLLLAREANVVVEDRRFATELRDSLLQHMQAGALPVAKLRWRRRALSERVLIWIAYGISRFLVGMFGYGRR